MLLDSGISLKKWSICSCYKLNKLSRADKADPGRTPTFVINAYIFRCCISFLDKNIRHFSEHVGAMNWSLYLHLCGSVSHEPRHASQGII